MQAVPLITKEQSAGGECGSFSPYISRRVGRIACVSLVREGGACIMYTHLAPGFLEKGKINKRFKVLME